MCRDQRDPQEYFIRFSIYIVAWPRAIMKRLSVGREYSRKDAKAQWGYLLCGVNIFGTNCRGLLALYIHCIRIQ